jgi:predicted nuclease of predicted toxin-antitoxin system
LNLLIDAHLPRRMISWLTSAGCDAVHTLDLPDGNATTDDQVIRVADREGRVVVTKDSDFVSSHLLTGRPGKLLLISTGNISNQELEQLLVPLIPVLIREFQTQSFLELSRFGLIIRG